MNKIQVANKILENIDQKANINWNFKDTYINAILKGFEDLELIEVTHVDYCQSCSHDFENGEIVYYAPIDNSIICAECAKEHSKKDIREFKK